MKTITKTVLYLQLTALLLVTGWAAPATEKELPFRGSIQAAEENDLQLPTVFVDASGSGNANHLGRFTVTYQLEVDFPNLFGVGPAQFIAANGDKISTEIVSLGFLTEDPAVLLIIDTHTITGRTGRVDGATGSFTAERFVSLVTGLTAGIFEGTIIVNKTK